jgi:hypothetical protein
MGFISQLTFSENVVCTKQIFVMNSRAPVQRIHKCPGLDWDKEKDMMSVDTD